MPKTLSSNASVRFLLATLFLAFALAGCSGDSSTGPAEDKIVGGINFTELFAPPTVAELAAVEADWAGRDVSAQDVQVVSSMRQLVRVSATRVVAVLVRVVSHTVGGVRHYGAIVSLPGVAASARLPVIVYSHDGDDGVDLDFLLNGLWIGAPALGDLLRKYVLVVPSFRSEPLTANLATDTSGGAPSPWDYDVDDALALINVTLQITPEADPESIGVLGFSRGASVGMLMAIRDSRIDLVIEFFGPTDFLGEFVQTLTEEALLGNPRDLPGLDYLNDTFIQPLKDSALTIPEARMELVRRSPVYFADQIPDLQVHHGTADQTVPVSEAERLISVMRNLGRGEPEFEYYVYEGGRHDFFLPGALDRAVTFAQRLTGPVGRAAVDSRGLMLVE